MNYKPPTKMIRAILFDWGGVLIDNPSDALIAYCARKLNTDPVKLKRSFGFYEDEFQRGTLSEEKLWQKIGQTLSISPIPTSSLWKEAVTHVFADRAILFNLLPILRKQGYKVGLLSNTEHPAVEYFFEKQYNRYFDTHVFSCEEHTRKPEKEIYLRAIQRLALKEDECLFIDDKTENVLAAKKIGMHAIHYQTDNQVIRELHAYGITTDETIKRARE